MELDIKKIAEELLEQLKVKSEKAQVQAEGVVLLFEAIKAEVQKHVDAQSAPAPEATAGLIAPIAEQAPE